MMTYYKGVLFLHSLADYAYFVAEVRKNLESMPLQEAVEQAVNVCIEKDILKDFLLEQKSEVIAMSIYEYNEEYVRKILFEDGMEKERLQGIRVLVETCKEVGLTKEETLVKLEEKYNLSKESADEHERQNAHL